MNFHGTDSSTEHTVSHPLIILALLFAINTLNFFDRQILAAISEPIRREWRLSDTQLGWLGTAFTLLYALIGVPLGRLADVWRRKHLLAICLTLWSVLTYLSGWCRGFWTLFVARMGVGIGEAGCAPAASSMIGDIFIPHLRARALSVFMLGLPAGVSLSYIISGIVSQHYGWRSSFFLAGIPGLILAALLVPVREPARGRAETTVVGAARRTGSPYLIVLGVPTMWWIIASGAIHNFSMYALTYFLPAFLMRYHLVSVQTAGLISGGVIGSVGAVGMLLGGWLGDRWFRRWPQARLTLAGAAVLISVPAGYLALNQASGALPAFVLFQALGVLMMYVYYATVYSTIQDILEPALRGTGMALYFLAMYVLGASLGPLATGWLSDTLAGKAALSAHAILSTGAPIPEQFKAAGLHQAMYMVPALGIVLAAVLFVGALTVGKDMIRLQEWMHRVSIDNPKPGG